jgi:hypothetical protein
MRLAGTQTGGLFQREIAPGAERGGRDAPAFCERVKAHRQVGRLLRISQRRTPSDQPTVRIIFSEPDFGRNINSRLAQDLDACKDALIADKNRHSRDQLANLGLGLAAEGATEGWIPRVSRLHVDPISLGGPLISVGSGFRTRIAQIGWKEIPPRR